MRRRQSEHWEESFISYLIAQLTLRFEHKHNSDQSSMLSLTAFVQNRAPQPACDESGRDFCLHSHFLLPEVAVECHAFSRERADLLRECSAVFASSGV